MLHAAPFFRMCTLLLVAIPRSVAVLRARCTVRTLASAVLNAYSAVSPGCFFFVGAALPGEARPHHKSVFDFDEVGICAPRTSWSASCASSNTAHLLRVSFVPQRALFVGASIFVQIIRNELGRK